MICPTCSGSRLAPAADPAVCMTCNGSGLHLRIGDPVSALIHRGDELYSLAAHDQDRTLRPGEEREVYREAGRLYAAAARLRNGDQRLRLAALSYLCLDRADYRVEGRRILASLGYTDAAREGRIIMIATVGGVQ